MEITYTQKGDYLYPNLAIDPEDQVDASSVDGLWNNPCLVP